MNFTGTSPLIQGGAEQEPGEARCRGRLWPAHDPPLHAQQEKQPVGGWYLKAGGAHGDGGIGQQ